MTEAAPECLRGGSRVQCGQAGQRDSSHLGGLEKEDVRFHTASQNSTQFKLRSCLLSVE